MTALKSRALCALVAAAVFVARNVEAAIHAFDADGTLRGLLGKGRGEETLTPVP